MKRYLSSALIVWLLLVLAGCASNPRSNGQVNIPTATAAPSPQAALPTMQPTSEPATSEATPSAQVDTHRLLNTCNLVTAEDAGRLMSSAEVQLPTHQVGSVQHLVFSPEPIQAQESSCIYYAWHRANYKDFQMRQVTYWVDVPTGADQAAWEAAWDATRQQAARPIGGVGEQAFFKDGRLTFKQAGLYVTVEVVSVPMSTNAQEGLSQQIEMETHIAQAASRRLG